MDVVKLAVIGRSVGLVASIAAAAFLMWKEKDGWGWLIFLAIVLSSYSVKSD